MMQFIPVILCGGCGSRLWPVSRGGLAKPYIRLPGMKRTLLAETYARLRGTNARAVITVAAAPDLFLCKEEAANHAPEIPHCFIGEPSARDTAAAVLSAALYAARRFGEDAVLLALPADHVVGNADVFWGAAECAVKGAAAGRIALLGVAPDYPAAGYGYIECGGAEAGPCRTVRRFVEKPDSKRAAEFIASGNFLWNAGIFCMTPKTLSGELPSAAPQFCAPAEALKKAVADDNEWLPPKKEYAAFPAMSFDRAVLENTNNAVVAAAEGAGWSDVGAWRSAAETFLAADENGNRLFGEAELLDCKNCFIAGGGRLIAGVGLSGVHIVDTPDALLVSAAESSERVREVYARLQQKSNPRALEPNTVRRPWGSYTVLSEGAGYKVKRIEVKPGGVLSLQSHRRRSENWTAVEGEMGAEIGGRELLLRPGESCFVPKGEKHRMFNRGEKPAAVVEVQTGDYLGEDDIVRYEDIYGRV